MSRIEIVERNFLDFVGSWKGDSSPHSLDEPLRPESRLTGRIAKELFESQITSRLLDYEARKLRAQNLGFYTIGSAGHEGNAVLGRLLRVEDPCFLHYRSGALMLERSKKLPGETPVEDTLLSFCAAASEPAAGGRHKVWGSKRLWVPPQTSTIASHLPKAVGAALSIGRARRLGIPLAVPYDSIVACSFGDASTYHSTALGAINAAQAATFQRLPMPILFVCEDNDIGISFRTPPGWIQANFSSRAGLRYVFGDGLDLVSAFDAAAEAIDLCRRESAPVFLHLKTVRLFGHAGSDVESEYLSTEEIEEFESRDPLLRSAALLLKSGAATAGEITAFYKTQAKEIADKSKAASRRPKLSTVKEITAPLAPYHPDEVQREACRVDYVERRVKAFGSPDGLPETSTKARHLAMLINWGLTDLMAKYREMMVFGEDVAKKGGVYHVTTGLIERFGAGRVFNSILDEQAILGIAMGAGQLGFLPVPEIQYLAYFHNAGDQIRSDGASMQFFSNGQFKNPMVIRIASFAYQKGFGGHFHNDNAVNAIREIPGVVIAVPSRGDDAVEMLRTAMALAKVDGRIVFFLEPIALYMTKDLHEAGDGLWQFKFPTPGTSTPLGEGRVYNQQGKDLTIVTYANGLHMSLRAAKILKEKHGADARVLDLRWLAPLPADQILEHARSTGRVLVVDECRKSGGVADAILALVAERVELRSVKLAKLTAVDTYLPLGPSANLVLPTEDQIISEALNLMK